MGDWRLLIIDLRVSAGMIFNERCDLLVHVRGLDITGRPKCEATVLERDDRSGALLARDLVLVPQALQELGKLLEEAGLPTRPVRAQGEIDTSDCSTSVRLWVDDGTRQGAVDLHLLASGYEGADAPALKSFFARLLEMLGVRSEGMWSALADRAPS